MTRSTAACGETESSRCCRPRTFVTTEKQTRAMNGVDHPHHYGSSLVDVVESLPFSILCFVLFLFLVSSSFNPFFLVLRVHRYELTPESRAHINFREQRQFGSLWKLLSELPDKPGVIPDEFKKPHDS